VPLWLDRETPEGAVRRVTRTLTEEFGGHLDVTLLGMGDDGHVASLFPEHPALEATGLVTLVDDSPKPPPERITLTLPLLGTANHAVLVATGAGKRGALSRLRDGDLSLPAARLPNLTVVTDQSL
jgi:6-phosphogluconolactonase